MRSKPLIPLRYSCIVEAVKKVAADLRNTPAVCRKFYMNPLVFDAWRSRELHNDIGETIIGAPRRAEPLVPGFLRPQSRSQLKAARMKRSKRDGQAKSRRRSKAPEIPMHASAA